MTKKTKSQKPKKIAVVLLNLGGPDSKNAIRPFLMNFFMDKNILRMPVPFRCFLAAFIAWKRTKKEAGESYHELGDKSPLLENSQKQAKALQTVLNKAKGDKFKVFVSMRYWHPMAPQVVREVRDWGADKVVLLPLYPQFSTTTTWSSFETWKKAAFEAGYDVDTSLVCCYPFNDGFVQASADNILKLYQKAQKDGHQNPHVLFSAHGLPESVIKDGDPYQWQCEQTAEKIAETLKQELGVDDLDWSICYQSRVGLQKWIGPSFDEALERLAQEGKAVVVYPHAFTQEHVETLVELDIEYKEKAEELRLPGYYRADTVGTHSAYIESLAGIVNDHKGATKTGRVSSDRGSCLCPGEFTRCCMKSTG